MSRCVAWKEVFLRESMLGRPGDRYAGTSQLLILSTSES
jgi:hypothetical protein